MKRKDKSCKRCQYFIDETPKMKNECELGEDIELEERCNDREEVERKG